MHLIRLFLLVACITLVPIDDGKAAPIRKATPREIAAKKQELAVKRDKKYKGRLYTAFRYKTCDKDGGLDNYDALRNLYRASRDNGRIFKLASYGSWNYKRTIIEKCEQMFPIGNHKALTGPLYQQTTIESNIECEVCSLNHDNSILHAINRRSNDEFYGRYENDYIGGNSLSTQGLRSRLQVLIHAPFEKFNRALDKTAPRTYALGKINTMHSYKAYLVFTVTPEVQQIIDHLTNTPKDQNPKLSGAEYQTLKTNLAYIGAGRQGRETEHIVGVNHIFAGRFAHTQPLHWHLARGHLQGLFDKILVVPVHGCNTYPSCVYTEMTLIWAHPDHTMNKGHGDFFQFTPKLCVNPQQPRMFLQGALSKESQQQTADYSMEAGVRQISNIGEVIPLQTSIGKQDENIPMPFLKTAYMFERENLKFYRFGTRVYCRGGEDGCPAAEGEVVMVPFDRFDFEVIKEIVKIRLVNDAIRYLKKVKPLKKFYKAVKRDLISYRDTELTIDDTSVQLSAIVTNIYTIVNIASNKMDNCKEPLKIKIAMFKASFENRLFTGIFQKTPELRAGESDGPLPNPRQLTVPITFINPHAKQQRKGGNTGKHKCPNCGKKFDKKSLLDYHIEGEKGERSQTCDVCRQSYSSHHTFAGHQRQPFHILNALGQGLFPHVNQSHDPIIARFICPLDHSSEEKPVFRFESDCLSHVATHTNNEIETLKTPLRCTDSLDVNGVPEEQREVKGTLKCNVCLNEFKTDSQMHAQSHFGEVHMLHVGLEEFPDKRLLKQFVPRFFDVDGRNELRPGGNSECKICHQRFPTAPLARIHLAGKFHEWEMVNRKLAGEAGECLRSLPRVKDQFLALFEASGKKDVSSAPASALALFDGCVRNLPRNSNTRRDYYWHSSNNENEPQPRIPREYYTTIPIAYKFIWDNTNFVQFTQSARGRQIVAQWEREKGKHLTDAETQWHQQAALSQFLPFREYIETERFPHLKLKIYSIN